jgi:pimeloyl-ACP methyl ester carboxylesterase
MMSELQSKDFFIRAAGHRLRVRRLTQPEKSAQDHRPTLVFLHEALGSIELWHDFPSTLVAATGCNALIYDRWGHGESDLLTGRRTLRYVHDEALESLPEVLEKSAVSDAILIGHSDGGSIALIYAAEHREVARGLITEAAHVFVDEVTLNGIREAVEVYETTNLKEKLSRYHGNNTEIIFRAWCDTWLSPQFEKWNIEECLPKIKCPVLVIQGEDDQYGTKAQVESITTQVAGPSKSLLIPNCAHIPHKQARDRVVKEMTEFILTLFQEQLGN